MEKAPDLSICIVSYNVQNELRKCLNSIQQHVKNLSYEILLVDNDSLDQTADMIVKEFPAIQFFPQKKNIGFAAGCNVAIKASKGTMILLLNPDTILHEQSLEKMTAFLDTHPEIGIIGPQLLNTDGTIQNGLRQFPTAAVILARYTFLKKFPFFRTRIDRYRMRNADLSVFMEVDQVSGAAMMFSRKTLDRIGLMDERFFIFCEEVDFCRRAREKNLSVCYLPDAQITHSGGQSRKQVNNLVQFYRFESYMKYLQKNMRPFSYLLFMIFFKMLFSLTLLTECFIDLFLRNLYVLIGLWNSSFNHSKKFLNWENKYQYRKYFLKNKWINFLIHY